MMGSEVDDNEQMLRVLSLLHASEMSKDADQIPCVREKHVLKQFLNLISNSQYDRNPRIKFGNTLAETSDFAPLYKSKDQNEIVKTNNVFYSFKSSPAHFD